MKTISKTWDHLEHEEELYKRWEDSGYFKPESGKWPVSADLSRLARAKADGQAEVGKVESGKEEDFKNPSTLHHLPSTFSIMMPPPNVTGKLHIGHALFVTLEDIMTRYHRLLGEETLWLPGTDHAGIATQTVVDKELRKQGIDRRELGREKFIEKVWQWKEKYGNEITNQIRRLGASCDWSREKFTLDPDLSKAVTEAFTILYNKGLIYRGEYIVNWCPRCQTAIADDEVLYQPQKAKLYYFKYDKNFPITIATTRPETKLGDTAVAVNPSDKRYMQYVGKKYDVDLDGVKRKIKIIADRSIDKEFGTGAVGVTPAHSALDWKIAEANNLPKIKIIDEQGKMAAEAGKYQGMKVIEAREKLVEYLRSSGLLEKEQEIKNNLSVCYRCETGIEPLPSLQWFVKTTEMAKRAKKIVEDEGIEIIPKRFEKVYFHWLDNIRDWCISRQLWWGHRIPVYYRKPEISKSEFLISKKILNSRPTADQPQAEKSEKLQTKNDIYVGSTPPKEEGWVQDEDVLDTWFSSALWPFSTLGWPDEQSSDYQKYYPTTVLETGYDILFFWVARMIMMGLELTDKPPFKTVYLHGLVRDEHNRKMSKSLGNVLDPLDEIEKYGTDALRMALVSGATPGNDIAVGDAKIRGMRNFSNKIWNAARFVALQVSDGDLQSGEIGAAKIENMEIDGKALTEADKEAIRKHKEAIREVTDKLLKFQFSMAGEMLYEYFWHEFCDIYIESAKKQLQDESSIMNNELRVKNHNSSFTIHNSEVRENTKKILIKILSESLIMLHPFVPYVTEAVWQELQEVYPKLSESIVISKWPK